jgi:hypothetical protein
MLENNEEISWIFKEKETCGDVLANYLASFKYQLPPPL